MQIEENRQCNCAMEDNNTVNTVNTVDCDLRREMMNEIQGLDFAINELALYLDTHPEDERALCLHRKYARKAKDLKDKYQRVYGPLTINYPCNKWRWLEEPWVGFKLGDNIMEKLTFLCKCDILVKVTVFYSNA